MNFKDFSKLTNIEEKAFSEEKAKEIIYRILDIYNDNNIFFGDLDFCCSPCGFVAKTELLQYTEINKLKKICSNLAPFLGVHDICVDNDCGTIIFTVTTTDKPPFFSFSDVMSRSQKNSIVCGFDNEFSAQYIDIATAPHVLVAGQTGSGKSVFLNSCIISLLYFGNNLFIIDPKKVEFSRYNGIEGVEIANEPEDAIYLLDYATAMMDDRYIKLQKAGARDLETYNKKTGADLRRLVIVCDELSDLLMMGNRKEIEKSIVRIAQLGRACGVHLILATQRPTSNVLTGLIKSNIPTRISFSVSSKIDSRVILDRSGAEELRGRGDGLLLKNGAINPIRFQAPFLTDNELDTACDLMRKEEPKTKSIIKKKKQQSNDIFSIFGRAVRDTFKELFA